jgi:hypothetical protein
VLPPEMAQAECIRAQLVMCGDCNPLQVLVLRRHLHSHFNANPTTDAHSQRALCSGNFTKAPVPIPLSNSRRLHLLDDMKIELQWWVWCRNDDA